MRQHRFLTQSSISDGCFRFGPVRGGWVGEVYFRMQISPAFPGLLCKTGPQNKRRCWVVQNRPPFRSISLPLPLSLAHRVCVYICDLRVFRSVPTPRSRSRCGGQRQFSSHHQHRHRHYHSLVVCSLFRNTFSAFRVDFVFFLLSFRSLAWVVE